MEEKAGAKVSLEETVSQMGDIKNWVIKWVLDIAFCKEEGFLKMYMSVCVCVYVQLMSNVDTRNEFILFKNYFCANIYHKIN